MFRWSPVHRRCSQSYPQSVPALLRSKIMMYICNNIISSQAISIIHLKGHHSGGKFVPFCKWATSRPHGNECRARERLKCRRGDDISIYTDKPGKEIRAVVPFFMSISAYAADHRSAANFMLQYSSLTYQDHSNGHTTSDIGLA